MLQWRARPVADVSARRGRRIVSRFPVKTEIDFRGSLWALGWDEFKNNNIFEYSGGLESQIQAPNLDVETYSR